MGRITYYLKRISSNDFLLGLALASLWHLGLIVVGSIIQVLNHQSIDILAQTNHWDAGWYQTIIRDSYHTSGPSAAFYPLFPLLVQAVHIASFGMLSYLASGLILNSIVSWLAIVGLIKIARHLLISKKQALLVVLLFLAFPAAFFLHTFYGEAIFCALGFWAYYWALKRQWAFMAICLGLLTASRLTAVLVIALCGLEYLRAHEYSPKQALKPSILWFLIAPAGFLAYSLYLSIVRHDPLAMFHAYHLTTDWIYHQFNLNIVDTFFTALRDSINVLTGSLPLTPINIINLVIPTLALLLLLGSSLYLLLVVKSWGVPLALSGLLGFVMFTLNSNVISVHRYVLPCIGTYIAIAHAMRLLSTKLRVLVTLILISSTAAVMVLLLALFITDRFAG